MTPLKHEDELEDLLSSALIEHSNSTKHKHSVTSKQDWNQHYKACFTRPENWVLQAQVRLVHVEGSIYTLVGLFDELVHSYVPKCRRLVAASTANPALPTKQEEVRGDHWLPGERLSLKRQPSERTHDFAADLVLEMGQLLEARAVLLQAHLVGGGLQRLCLLEDTIFEGSTPRTILSLPCGLDVLEGLSGGCKVAVWKVISNG